MYAWDGGVAEAVIELAWRGIRKKGGSVGGVLDWTVSWQMVSMWVDIYFFLGVYLLASIN